MEERGIGGQSCGAGDSTSMRVVQHIHLLDVSNPNDKELIVGISPPRETIIDVIWEFAFNRASHNIAHPCKIENEAAVCHRTQ